MTASLDLPDLRDLRELAPPRIAAGLTTRRLGRAYRWLESCASTSDEAARLARGAGGQGQAGGAEAAEGLLVVAETQTGGRGRLGRVWHSPPGENLYLSLLLRPALSPLLIPPLTLLVGAVLAEVLEAAGATPRLKWPNDVLLQTPQGPRKAAGILTEMATLRDRARQVVVGVGINVNTRSFPPELAERATSLRLATGQSGSIDRGALLVALLNALEPAYDRFVAGGPAEALDLWRARAALGARCRVDRGGSFVEGVAVDVDADGALLVRDDREVTHRVVSGEVEADRKLSTADFPAR